MGVTGKLHKWISDRRLDLFLHHRIPGAYRAACAQDVQKNKVLMIELRLPQLSSNFRLLYDRLQEDGRYEIHVHCLQYTFVPYRTYMDRCEEMIRDLATAEYVFVCEASNVLSCIDKRPETVVTQLWHACGAFKRFGMSTALYRFGGSKKDQTRYPLYGNYNYVTVSSPEIVWAYAEAMNLQGREEIIRPVGISRTDIFYQEEALENARRSLEQHFPAAEGKKVILYAPTFRGRVADPDTPDQLDTAAFAKALGEEYVLVTKHHPLVRRLPSLPADLEGSFAYDATKEMSIEDLLMCADICISDYSSLIYEYSLFERPMLFFAYDLEEYFDWRGFYYPYEELTPGPVCRSNEEMIDWILHLEDTYDPEAVHAFRERFMSACDGHATERIMRMVFGEKH